MTLIINSIIVPAVTTPRSLQSLTLTLAQTRFIILTLPGIPSLATILISRCKSHIAEGRFLAKSVHQHLVNLSHKWCSFAVCDEITMHRHLEAPAEAVGRFIVRCEVQR